MTKQPRTTDENAQITDIGKRIRCVRELNKVSQSELARLCGTDQSKWSKYEYGQRMPDPFEMMRFCERFGCTLDYLYRGRLDRMSQSLAQKLFTLHPELVTAT